MEAAGAGAEPERLSVYELHGPVDLGGEAAECILARGEAALEGGVSTVRPGVHMIRGDLDPGPRDLQKRASPGLPR
jgi:hypothetical protein